MSLIKYFTIIISNTIFILLLDIHPISIVTLFIYIIIFKAIIKNAIYEWKWQFKFKMFKNNIVIIVNNSIIIYK